MAFLTLVVVQLAELTLPTAETHGSKPSAFFSNISANTNASHFNMPYVFYDFNVVEET